MDNNEEIQNEEVNNEEIQNEEIQDEGSNVVYVVVNGDGVGQTMGESISNNDIEGLKSHQGKINDMHIKIEQWVEQNGGEVISSSGDESIFTISSDLIGELESIAESYSESTGHSATVGVGNSISDAVKALVYGKNSQKGSVVQFSPELEGEDEEEGLESPEEEGIEQEIEGQEAGVPQEGEEELEEEGIPQEEGELEEGVPQEEGIPQEGELEEGIPQEGEEELVEEEGIPEEENIPQEEGEEGLVEEEGVPEEGEEEGLQDVLRSHLEIENEGDEENSDEVHKEELKNEIGNALELFQANREMLEQLQSSNPDLYTALLTMVGSMIHMSKMIGLDSSSEDESQGLQNNKILNDEDEEDGEELNSGEEEDIEGK